MILSRRHIVAGAAGAAALSIPLTAFGQSAATDKRLFVIILRGGLDGLSALPANGDPAFASMRERLAIPRRGEGAGLVLDDTFALHPNLTNLHALYQAGELLPLHAVATGYRERSHFDAQNVLETGAAAPFARGVGWLNAALGALPQSRPELGVAIAEQAPLVLRGPAHVATWSPSALPDVDNDTLQRLMALYQRTDADLAHALEGALAANGIAGDSGADTMEGRAGRQVAPMARAAARFLKDPAGPIAAVLDVTGWDTHANQGPAFGPLARGLSGLDAGVAAFKDEMGPAWRNCAVIIVTEFGRTVSPNGANGTDHGTGAAAFLAGGAIQGGRVLVDWPGVQRSALHEGRDLRPTTDLRAVFKGVLSEHLQVPARALESDAFPDSAGVTAMSGLVRA